MPLILALWAFGCSSVLASERAFIERIDARASLTLWNGLEIHVIQVASPLVASLAIVKAGSQDEDETVRGVSHLLEHLVFDGTERRTKEQLFREIYGIGGYVNGFTQEDLTGYILMAHPDFLGQLLDIQADLLFHALIAPPEVDVAKKVVTEEIRQALANPVSREEVLHKANMYAGTSYAFPVLGTEEGIARITRDQILAYYRRYYVPNNTVLVVIGPTPPREVFRAFESRFGSYPAVTLPPRQAVERPSAQRSRIVVFETGAGRKAVRIGLPLNPTHGAALPLLDLLTTVLTTRMKQAFETPSQSQTFHQEVSLSLFRDLLTLDILVTFPEETPEDRVLERLLQEMARLAREGVEEAELDLAKRELRANEAFLRERIHYYAMKRAGQLLAVGPGALSTYLPGVRSATPAEVSTVARRILADPRFTASLFLPRSEGTERKVPAPLPAKKAVLDNGLTVITQEVPGSPVLAVHVLVRHRSASEPEGRAGIAAFLHRLLPRGTKNRTAEAIAETLQAIGGRLEVAGDPTRPFGDFYSTREFSYIRLEALAAFWREALDLLQDLVRNPLFAPQEVKRVRAELLHLIAARAKNPRRIAEDLLYATLYPDQPFGQPTFGTQESIRSITQADLEAFHGTYMSPSNLIVSVVSGLPASQMMEELEARFAKWEAKVSIGPSVKISSLEGSKLIRVKGSRPQSAIVIGKMIHGATERERVALEVAGSLLLARLFRHLREKEGLVYSIGVSVEFYEGSGLLTIQAGAAPQKVEKLKDGILRGLKATAEEGVTEEELNRRVNALSGRYTMRQLSSINRAFYLGVAEFKGLKHSYEEDYRQLLKGLSPEEVSHAAKQFSAGQEMVIAIVE